MYERNEPAEGTVEASRSGVSPTLIALVVIGIVVVVLVLQNGTSTQTNILMFDFETPLWVLLAIAIAAGVVLDRLFSVWWRRRRRDR